MYPVERPRRLRRTAALRNQIAETRLHPVSFVLPLFVVDGSAVRAPIASMPGQFRYSVDEVVKVASQAARAGVGGVLLFGIPSEKDASGTSSADPRGPVAEAIRAIKAEVPELVAWADVCLCEYTDHGHCGILDGEEILNDETLPLLANAAVAYADAGADVIAPSDMMDGRVGAIRVALDTAGYSDLPICSYAVKYASAFYGPFREAADSAPAFGDRNTYQMQPTNVREALREVRLDIAEGADLVMVKPAGAYLDVLARVRDTVDVPVVAYQVSGEYSMIVAASEQGWIDRERAMLESLTGMARAGADILVTYFAIEAANAIRA